MEQPPLSFSVSSPPPSFSHSFDLLADGIVIILDEETPHARYVDLTYGLSLDMFIPS